MTMRQGLILGLVAAASVAWTRVPVQAGGAMGTATIKGKVTYAGDPPKIKAIKMAGDSHCTKAHPSAVPDQGTIIYKAEGNAIPYVFVYLKKGVKDKYDPPAEAKVLDQNGCTYHPHVWGLVAGQGINIKNSDPTNHNIHSLAKKNPAFNFAQPQKDMVKELRGKDTFTREEVMVKIKCDVHAWMASYAGVLTHPFFAVTVDHESDGGDKAKRGTFEIAKVPAGEYEIAAWHETFGEVTQKITVADGETKEIEIKMGPGAKAEAPKAREVIITADAGGTESLEKK